MLATPSKESAVTRWKAIGILFFSAALLLTACGPSAADLGDTTLPDDEQAAAAESDSVASEGGESPSDDEAASGESDAAQADDETVPPPVDDETPGCDLPSDGPHPQVVPHVVMPAVNDSGNLHFNVQMCEPADPLMPFGQFYSGFFHCPPFFGYEIHAGSTLLYEDPVEANTLVDGSFWFDTGAPPPDPFPSSVPCRWASLNSQEDPVWSGEGVFVLPPPDTGNRDQLFPGSALELK